MTHLTMRIDTEMAEMLDELQAHKREELGIPVDRSTVVRLIIRAAWMELQSEPSPDGLNPPGEQLELPRFPSSWAAPTRARTRARTPGA